MNQFGELITVLATCITTTIGVCVYLLRAQQKERERQEDRADKRIDELLGLFRRAVDQQTEATEQQTTAIDALKVAIHELSEKFAALESIVRR